jgi:hypothetical protein
LRRINGFYFVVKARMARLGLKQLKRIQICAGTFLVMVWFTSWTVGPYYETKFLAYPRSPKPEIGFTNQYGVKGITVYAPEAEARRATLAREIFINSLWLAALFGAILNIYIKRKEEELDQEALQKSLLELDGNKRTK